ncbi:polysaccharide pyruvyl transferase family protein [Butyricicoccus sp.]|uniref:polysaccharide pyruvyl transferase family protein n=1 Tax=Butyricicoccus sp. TaxID=2049021 RepID=UPI003F180EB3
MNSSVRIGIVSTFYHNYNYGGKLQCYAMVQAIRRAGYEAEQLSYHQSSAVRKKTAVQKLQHAVGSMDYRHAVLQKLAGKCMRKARTGIMQRKAAFDRFDREIPHTASVYSDASIGQTLEQFDAFVCGSDQIWNPMLLKKGYFLDFVPKDRYTFSYAASVAAGGLSEEWQTFFREKLQSFDAISVRESNSRDQLQRLMQREIALTVDPTLLLTAAEWDELAGERVIQQPYIFCYFLGYSSGMRRAAQRFAKAHQLKIITLPHLLGTAGRFYPQDTGFGDEQRYDISPGEFLAFIRDAEYVMTDSFHAAVMSILFRKQFVVFDRTGHAGMGNRIDELLGMFCLNNQRCTLKSPFDDIRTKLEQPIAYRETYEVFEQRRQDSWEFLIQNLKKAEQRSLT